MKPSKAKVVDFTFKGAAGHWLALARTCRETAVKAEEAAAQCQAASTNGHLPKDILAVGKTFMEAKLSAEGVAEKGKEAHAATQKAHAVSRKK